MSQVTHLLFPCGSTQPLKKDIFRNKNEFSSAFAYLVTSLAISIIIVAVATLTAYFLTHCDIMWTSIAGGGAALVSGFMSYVILRCVFGRISQMHTNSLNEGTIVQRNLNFYLSETSSKKSAISFVNPDIILPDKAFPISRGLFMASFTGEDGKVEIEAIAISSEILESDINNWIITHSTLIAKFKCANNTSRLHLLLLIPSIIEEGLYDAYEASRGTGGRAISMGIAFNNVKPFLSIVFPTLEANIFDNKLTQMLQAGGLKLERIAENDAKVSSST